MLMEKWFVGEGKTILQHRFDEYILVVEKYPNPTLLNNNELIDPNKQFFAYLKEIPIIQASGMTREDVTQQVRDLFHTVLGQSLEKMSQMPHPYFFLKLHGQIEGHFEHCKHCKEFFTKNR